jgi:hypothetical protein
MTSQVTSSVEANRTLGRRFFEAQDQRQGALDPALCAPGYQASIGGYPPMDAAGHGAFGAAFYAGFPDIRHTFDEVIATEDRVIVRFILVGTHTGEFFGMPATGKAVRVAAHVILHVSGGQVSRLLGVFDEAGLTRQLSA